jgi:single stranded DNA-binding protein
MQKIFISGNLGKDSEIRTLENGNTLLSFSVASTEKWKDKNGEKKEKTIWFNCQKWNSDNMAQWLKKGCSVVIVGKVNEQKKEEKTYWSIDVETIEITKFANSEETKTTTDFGVKNDYSGSLQEQIEKGEDIGDLPF